MLLTESVTTSSNNSMAKHTQFLVTFPMFICSWASSRKRSSSPGHYEKHTRNRPASVTDTFFASWGCPATVNCGHCRWQWTTLQREERKTAQIKVITGANKKLLVTFPWTKKRKNYSWISQLALYKLSNLNIYSVFALNIILQTEGIYRWPNGQLP